MKNNIKDMLINTYNSTVKEYASHEFENSSMEKHYKKFLSLIPKKSKILDVGCGPGQASKKFADEGHEVIGIDLSEKMIEFAKEKIANAKFIVMDIEDIRIKERFDAIWAAFVLLHILRDKHKKIISKLFELLKPNGILYLGMIEGEGERIIPEPYNRKYKQFFVSVSKNEIKENLESVGFKLLKYSTEKFDEEGDVFSLSSTYAKK